MQATDTLTDLSGLPAFEGPQGRQPAARAGRRPQGPASIQAAIVAGVLVAAGALGYLGNPLFLIGGLAAAAALLTLAYPAAALVLLPWAALYLPLEVKASEVVTINIAVVITPVVVVAWLAQMIRVRRVTAVRTRLYLPMLALVLSASASWLLGNIYWSPFVPRPANVLLVQMGQWAIFVFSMLAVLLGLNLFRDGRWLRALVLSYLAAGAIAILLYTFPSTVPLAERLVQLGGVDSAYWVWMNSLLLSALLFHRGLRPPLAFAAAMLWLLTWRLALANSGWMSGMVPMAVSALALLALRLRRRFLLLLPVLAVAAYLAFPIIRQQLNLDREVAISGMGRLNHIRIVLMFALERPWFGLGMAAYRHYVATVPQIIEAMLHRGVGVSSHNNYVDIFAHMGVVGLAAFAWFAAALGAALAGAAQRHRAGFQATLAYAGIAAFAGILASGMLGDWFFPFVYNIGFKGMRTSITSWILFGAASGLVVQAFGRRRGIARAGAQPYGPGGASTDEQA